MHDIEAHYMQSATWQVRASANDDEKVVEEMKRAAQTGDVWSGEAAGVITKVGSYPAMASS